MSEYSVDSSVYIDGYFSRLALAGKLPAYGYPMNRIPEPKEESMDIVTSFIVPEETTS